MSRYSRAEPSESRSGKARQSAPHCSLVLATSDTRRSPGISPADPTGEWLVAKKLARIKIADCDGRLWGIVAWEAQPGIDNKNPDPNLRSRPTLGMPILLDDAKQRVNGWSSMQLIRRPHLCGGINLVDEIPCR
jgi:hypothetical protein